MATMSAASQFFSGAVPTIAFFVVAIIAIAGTWQIFIKMGKPGWKAIIPLYNEYVVFGEVWNVKAFWIVIATSIVAGICAGVSQILFETDLNIAAIVTSAISIILLIASFAYQARFCNKVAKAFGKRFGMTILIIFIPFVATLILGFGSAQYKGSQK